MSFISYAQNFEDVMLWRALRHAEKGFYIDVGAWSPDLDSVTKAFYERGWRGINIEPNPEFNRQLCERRPNDCNLRVAVGDQQGVLSMNFLGNPGLSTLDDAIAEQHRQAGWSLERHEVQVFTLASIWAEHVPLGQEVHFLKVDVEGFEEAALRGNDWLRHRPWVVVVEATLPMSQVESFESWEPILFGAGYCFAYADGLNRFYVAQEHDNLLSAFKYPPNVFDDFLLSQQQDAHASAAQAQARAAQAEARAAQAEAHMLQLLGSSSWRITAPLRAISKRWRWLLAGASAWITLAPGSRPQRLAKRILLRAHAAVASRSTLRRLIVSVAQRLGFYPALRRLYGRYAGGGEGLSQSYALGGIDPQSGLSPWGRQMALRLHAARRGIKQQEH